MNRVQTLGATLIAAAGLAGCDADSDKGNSFGQRISALLGGEGSKLPLEGMLDGKSLEEQTCLIKEYILELYGNPVHGHIGIPFSQSPEIESLIQSISPYMTEELLRTMGHSPQAQNMTSTQTQRLIGPDFFRIQVSVLRWGEFLQGSGSVVPTSCAEIRFNKDGSHSLKILSEGDPTKPMIRMDRSALRITLVPE